MQIQTPYVIPSQRLLKKKLNYTLNDFQILNIIGNGSQGDVYEAESQYFTEKVAIKSIKLPKSNFRSEKIIKRIQNEIIMNSEIQQSNENISKYFPQFYGYFIQNESFYMIFQLCFFNAMQVYQKLKTYSQKYTFCWILLHDMIKSLNLLQKKGFLHRDIKPQNILFKNNIFRLTDLGLGKQNTDSRNSTIDVGNVFSKAPQVYIGKFNPKSDVWSLGITVYYLLEGKLSNDNDTIKMMMQQDKIQNYIERMKNKQFFIDICSKHYSKEKNSFNYSLYEILSKMLIVPLEERYFASQINSIFFSKLQIEQIDYQNVIKDIISNQKSQHAQELHQFIKCLMLKHLQHRQTVLGIYFAILLCCIKEILRINKKMYKIHKFIQTNQVIKNTKKFLEAQLLKNIKTSCFKLIEVLCKIMLEQSDQNKQFIQPITSFGEIQLTIQRPQVILHDDYAKIQKFIEILLKSYDEYVTQSDQKQNQHIKKQIQSEIMEKTVKFNNVLTCISENNSDHQIKFIKMNKQHSCQKIKSKKKIQILQRKSKQKLPKSIRYINDEAQFQVTKTDEILQKFMRFYCKDKLKDRFPLLGQVGRLLKELIQSSDDALKRKILITREFKIWNLSLDLFRI